MPDAIDDALPSISKAGMAADTLEPILWEIASIFASLDSSATLAVNIAKTARKIESLGFPVMGGLPPNPYFSLNGVGRISSPVTKAYLQARLAKKLFAVAAATSSGAASTVTMIDLYGGASNSQSLRSTAAHMGRLNKISQSYGKSEKVSEWVKLIQNIKMIKGGSRLFNLSVSLLPIPVFGGLAGTAVVATTSAGVRLKYGTAIARAAMDLHWRAYREMKLSSLRGPQGPASFILFELFKRYETKRILGKYNVAAICREPAGWLFINDKLLS